MDKDILLKDPLALSLFTKMVEQCCIPSANMRITADRVIYATGDNKDRVKELSEMLDKRYVELSKKAPP